MIYVLLFIVNYLILVNGDPDPTHYPTWTPIPLPTLYPTPVPTNYPKLPTDNPTLKPISFPPTKPITNPTFNPTVHPTFNHTIHPTRNPTATLSNKTDVIIGIIAVCSIVFVSFSVGTILGLLYYFRLCCWKPAVSITDDLTSNTKLLNHEQRKSPSKGIWFSSSLSKKYFVSTMTNQSFSCACCTCLIF